MTAIPFGAIVALVDAPVFILGTGFDSGKTALACAVLRGLGARGLNVAGVKPVDTGCPYRDNHDLHSADGERLRSASSVEVPPLVTAPYRFPSRLEPIEAAAAAGIELTRADIISTIEVAAQFGRPIVEGPGGPDTLLTADFRTADLAGAVNADVIIVGRADRGFGSQLILTLAETQRRGLNTRVAVPLCPGPAASTLGLDTDATNVAVLPVFSAMQYGDAVDDLARFLESHGALEPLLG